MHSWWSLSHYWLSNSLSSFPALKNGTFLAGTATVAPVFGLRPSFMRLDRRRKLPNPRISVLSPFFNESLTQSKIVLTTISACRFVNVVTCSETRSMICAFVMSASPFAAAGGPPLTKLIDYLRRTKAHRSTHIPQDVQKGRRQGRNERRGEAYFTTVR